MVVNADKVILTSGKADDKLAYRHSGYPGGLRSTSYAELLEKSPDEMIRRSVRGMLPKNTLGRARCWASSTSTPARTTPTQPSAPSRSSCPRPAGPAEDDD